MKKYILHFILICFMVNACKKEQRAPVDCSPAITLSDTAVLLVLGQSNAGNFGDARYTAQCSNAQNFYQGQFYPLADPLHGANGDGGSVWSRLGDMLIANGLSKKVIIAPASVGGTYIEQWKPGGELNHLITETIESLRSKGLTITHVLWHQGEANNTGLNPGVPPAENAAHYRDCFLAIVQQLRSLQVDAPVFIAVATRCGNLVPDEELQRVQRELAVDSLGIFNGPDTDLLGSAYRYDDCHFNELGLEVHALLWADILLAH
jgi:hypothetical protein